MNFLMAVVLVVSLYFPFIARDGTNVGVQVNSPCGLIEGNLFALVFDDGTIIYGETDARGEWAGIGPNSKKVKFVNEYIELTGDVVDSSVEIPVYLYECPTG